MDNHWLSEAARLAAELDIAQQRILDTEQVTRVEVIDQEGRSYVNWNVNAVEFSLQDDAKTLKIFLS